MKPHLVSLPAFMMFVHGVTGASLTVSPSQVTIGGSNPTSQLTVGCRPTVPGITQVFKIEIGKKSAFGSNQPIIEMSNTDSSAQVVDTSLQQRMTASGSISGATGSIQFVLTDLRCDDDSTYYCTTLYLAGSAGSDEATVNITARTYPEQIEMFPSPDRIQYDDGQRISFRCTGKIGNVFDEGNLQNLWTWEWRSIGNEFSSWTRYPNDQNITYDRPTPSAGCQYTGASTLIHRVSNPDNGRQFRCSVMTADYSANKTVYVAAPTSTIHLGLTSTTATTIRTDTKPSPPTDFYCTEHSASSVKMQWTYNGTRGEGSMFVLFHRHPDSTVWAVTRLVADPDKFQTRQTLVVTQLQSDTLYYFRLLVDGGSAGESEAVTVTCFTASIGPAAS